MIFDIKYLRRNFLWSMLIIFAWLPCYAYTFGSPFLVSLGLYGTVCLFTAYFCMAVVKTMKINRKTMGTLVLIVYLCVYYFFKIPYVIDGSGRDFIYLLFIILGFALARQQCIKKEYYHIMYVVPTYLSYMMAFFALLPTSYDLDNYANALYLQFQNPNILSFVLLNMVIFECLGYLEERKKIYLLAVLISIILVILTHCRASLLSVILVLTAFLCTLKKYYIKKWFAVICTLFPLCFVYAVLPLNNVSFSIFGKSGVSGRDVIWKEIMDVVYANPNFFWFGNGTYYNGYSKKCFTNAHNAYLQLINDFGVPVLLVVLFCIVTVTLYATKKINNKYTFFAFIGTFSILVNCSFETHIVDGISGLTLMWIFLYWIIISKGEQHDYTRSCIS